MPSVMFDAVLVPGGAASAQVLARNGDAVHFVLEAYKHCKTICVIGEGVQLLRTLGIGAGEGGAGRARRGDRKERSADARPAGAGIHRRDGASSALVAAQRRSSPRLIAHQVPCCSAA